LNKEITEIECKATGGLKHTYIYTYMQNLLHIIYSLYSLFVGVDKYLWAKNQVKQK